MLQKLLFAATINVLIEFRKHIHIFVSLNIFILYEFKKEAILNYVHIIISKCTL